MRHNLLVLTTSLYTGVRRDYTEFTIPAQLTSARFPRDLESVCPSLSNNKHIYGT